MMKTPLTAFVWSWERKWVAVAAGLAVVVWLVGVAWLLGVAVPVGGNAGATAVPDAVERECDDQREKEVHAWNFSGWSGLYSWLLKFWSLFCGLEPYMALSLDFCAQNFQCTR